jgi:hypothetical protein
MVPFLEAVMLARGTNCSISFWLRRAGSGTGGTSIGSDCVFLNFAPFRVLVFTYLQKKNASL